MKHKLLILALLFSGLVGMAQPTMNVYLDNGSVVPILVQTIDSITMNLTPPPPAMLVFLSNGDTVSFPLASIDTVVYTGTNTALTDVDGNTYSTVVIGTQEWMAENLRTVHYNDGDTIEFRPNANWSILSTSGSYCLYENDPSNDIPYGKLYDWAAVNSSHGLCPTGWHVPSVTEFDQLSTTLGGNSIAGGKLKTTGTIDDTTGLWIAPNISATNESGFNAVPAGRRDSNASLYKGERTYWWTRNSAGSYEAHARLLKNDNGTVYTGQQVRHFGFSVRCMRNLPKVSTSFVIRVGLYQASCGGQVLEEGTEAVIARGVCWSTSPNPTIADSATINGTGMGTFESVLTSLQPNTTYYVRAYASSYVGTTYGFERTFTTHDGSLYYLGQGAVDADGNYYGSIVLGNQEWTSESLKANHYANGDPILQIENNSTWVNTTAGANCWLGNDSAYFGHIRGKLYNYYATTDPRNICPVGWHVPSAAEWEELILYIDPSSAWTINEAGLKMRHPGKLSDGTGLWNSSSTGFTNASGFTGFPSGWREGQVGGNGYFVDLHTSGYYWTTDLSVSEPGNAQMSRFNGGKFEVDESGSFKATGYGIRCIKD